jgi:Uma2 family endonuclease
MSVTTQVMTAEGLLKMPEDGFRYELVKGELRKMAPPGYEPGKIAAKIVESLEQHVTANNLRVVLVETGFKLASDPNTVRTPDVAFISWEQVEATGNVSGYFPGAPNLAVEIILPNDNYSDVEEKVFEWLSSGVQMVIVINLCKRTVVVYYSDSRVRYLTEQNMLEGGKVVPGWRIPVRDLFV